VSELDALDVYLHGTLAGKLERLSQARLRFGYDDAWVSRERPPLSLSLPVRAEPYGHEECAPFFEGLLPEGDFLKAIARTLHVSATNSFQLLTELGGECAGAISVAPSGGPEPGSDPRPPRWLNEADLGALLADLPRRPLIAAIDEEADGGGFRLSLAGAQNKVGVLSEDDRVGLSYGKPPTTSILKAPIPHVSESVANEAFCMSLAGHVDLDVAVCGPRIAAGQEYLLVHRYDRGPEFPDGRIHQEDFCQALGLVPAVKYEREGGPTVADCADLLRRYCSAPARDITAFLDALLFNFAIANHDGHSKNYSLLLDGPGSIRLAPLYDLISTAVYAETDRKLAMRYGGENRPAYLRGRHLDRLAESLAVKPALVRRRAVAMRERVEAVIEAARRSLPVAFQDRPIIEEAIGLLDERLTMLAERAAEARESRRPLASGDVESIAADFERVAETFSGRFVSLNEDLGLIVERVDAARMDLESGSGEVTVKEVEAVARRLASEIERPARRVKEHGREIFDSVVELDSVVDDVLTAIEQDPDGLMVENDGLSRLLGLPAVVDQGIGSLEELYSAIHELGSQMPLLFTPIRNVRAGLRDVIDARPIFTEWEGRARALSGQANS
jgi:serine/threonine-protein kinase HipA